MGPIAAAGGLHVGLFAAVRGAAALGNRHQEEGMLMLEAEGDSSPQTRMCPFVTQQTTLLDQ